MWKLKKIKLNTQIIFLKWKGKWINLNNFKTNKTPEEKREKIDQASKTNEILQATKSGDVGLSWDLMFLLASRNDTKVIKRKS